MKHVLSKQAHGIMVLISFANSEGCRADASRADSPESLHIHVYSIELDVGLDQESDI